jgi:adenylate cyclase
MGGNVAEERVQRRLAAILAADVVGYSRLIRADEEGTIAALKALRVDLIDPKIAEHHGRIVKLMGDGILAEFPSVVDAVRAAVEIQTGVIEHNSSLPDEERITFRVGINLGDVVIDGDDIHGDGVNVAARLEGLAQPGGVCISGAVHEQVRDRLDVPFKDLGEQQVKNIERPITVWQWLPGVTPSPITADVPLALPDKSSIAVLPFANLSGDPEQEYFADGMTEDITTELSRYTELFVIARNTAFAYKGQTPNIIEVGRELGVQFVLEGSVRKAGNRVRINAQLIDGQNGNHLWAERYDGKVDEIFDLQDEVTRQVVSATVPHITEAELARFRRGGEIFDNAQDLAWQALDDLENAHRLSEPVLVQAAKTKAYDAIQLNERCFRAYYVICLACWREILAQWSDDLDESRRQMKEAAETYVSLAPRSHRSHLCNGLAKFNAGNNEGAAENLRHSVELNPNDAMVLSILSYVEVQLGNLKEAKSTAERAIRLNPKDTWTGAAYLALAQAAFVEDDSQFRHWGEKAIQAQPNAPIRRALMIAHAAEAGNQALLDEHLQHLNTIAPRFIPRLLSGEADPIKIPQYREKFLSALRKAVAPE